MFLKNRDVRPRRFRVQSNPPFRDQMFSFNGHFDANHATHFAKKKKNETGIRPNAKNTKIQQC